MKLHLAYPETGCNKSITIDDENKVRVFYDKRISEEVSMDTLGAQFKNYVVKITGGCDKAGFPMKQGVLTTTRVKLLIPKGTVGFQKWRGKDGERRRKSVRGCVVSPDIAVLNLIIVKKGDTDIDGLTNATKPRTLGPKRASRIRKLFNLTKQDDVRDYVIKHKVTTPDGKELMVAPKIQRLLTPAKKRRQRLLERQVEARKSQRVKDKKNYAKLVEKVKAQKIAEKEKKVEVKPTTEQKPVEKKQPEQKPKKKVEQKKTEKVKKPVAEKKPKVEKKVEKKQTEKKPHGEKKQTEKKPQGEKKQTEKKQKGEQKGEKKFEKKTQTKPKTEKKKGGPKKTTEKK